MLNNVHVENMPELGQPKHEGNGISRGVTIIRELRVKETESAEE
jgi:hypothetical protein